MHETTTSQLECIGHGSLSVPLRGRPISIDVKFVDEPKPVPCNPSKDTVSWKLDEVEHRNRINATLIINWDIASGTTRTIEWTVKYS